MQTMRFIGRYCNHKLLQEIIIMIIIKIIILLFTDEHLGKDLRVNLKSKVIGRNRIQIIPGGNLSSISS